MRSQKATIFHRQVFHFAQHTPCSWLAIGSCNRMERVIPIYLAIVDAPINNVSRGLKRNLYPRWSWCRCPSESDGPADKIFVHMITSLRIRKLCMLTIGRKCLRKRNLSRGQKKPLMFGALVLFYTWTKSWRAYIFTAVCLCMCLSVCPALLVNKIPAERMHRFGRGFC